MFKSPPTKPTARNAIQVGTGQYATVGGSDTKGRWIHATWAGSNIDLRFITNPSQPATNAATHYHGSGRNYGSFWIWVDGGSQLWARRSSGSGSVDLSYAVYSDLANFGPEAFFM